MLLSINFPKEGMILVNINNRGSVRLFVHSYRMRVLIFAGNPRKFRSLMHHALLIFMRNSHQLGASKYGAIEFYKEPQNRRKQNHAKPKTVCKTITNDNFSHPSYQNPNRSDTEVTSGAIRGLASMRDL